MFLLRVLKFCRVFAWFLKIVMIISIVISIGLLAITGGLIKGYSAQVVISGSMEPQIKTGSLVITRRDSLDRYYRGEIITFYSPTEKRKLITHRVEKVSDGVKGATVIYTKGDANTNGDPWSVSVALVVGRVIMKIPYLGYWLNFMRTSFGFLGFIILTFTLLIRSEIKSVLAFFEK